MEKLQIMLPFQAGQSQRYTTNTDLYAQTDGCEHEDLDALFGTRLSTKSSQQDNHRQPQVNTLEAPELQSHNKQYVPIKKLRITLPFKTGQFQAYTTNTDLYAQSDGCEHENLDALFGIKSSVKSPRSADSHRSNLNSLPTRPVQHQIKEERCRRWWHRLEDVDPISLESLAELEYPPFELKSSDDSSNGQINYFDGNELARYIVESGTFINPVTRRQLNSQDCKSLDLYLATNGLEKRGVSAAFALHQMMASKNKKAASRGHAIPETSHTAIRRRLQRREATAIVHSMLHFPSVEGDRGPSSTTTTSHSSYSGYNDYSGYNNYDGRRSSRYRYRTGTRTGGGGYSVIDDDDWQTCEEFGNIPTATMAHDFPTLPRSRGAQAAAPPSISTRTTWGDGKGLGAVRNAPASSKLTKAEATDNGDGKEAKARPSKIWHHVAANKKRLVSLARSKSWLSSLKAPVATRIADLMSGDDGDKDNEAPDTDPSHHQGPPTEQTCPNENESSSVSEEHLITLHIRPKNGEAASPTMKPTVPLSSCCAGKR